MIKEIKEALNILYNIACIDSDYQQKEYITYAKEIEHNELVKKYFDIISQALDDLEKIKYICHYYHIENNEELRQALSRDFFRRGLLFNLSEDYVQKSKKIKCSICEWFNIESLRKHNQEVEIENSKFKKAIELLKDKMGLVLFNTKPYELWLEKKSEEFTQEEYDLLKEVLG